MNKLKSMGKRDLIFLTIVHASVIAISAVILYALWFVVIASVSDPNRVASGEVLFLPKGITLEGCKYIFRDKRIWTGYRNTILYTTVGTLIGLFITIPAGYALSKKDMVGKGIIMKLLVFTKYFSGGLIPTYLVVKRLHLVNTPYVLMIMGSFSVFNLILCRTFFINTLPQELQEAAEIDGCTIFQYFVKIVLPLSKAALASIGLMFAVAYWNDYTNYKLYITDSSLYNFQMKLRSIMMGSDLPQANGGATENTVKSAAIIIAILPFMILYPFLQKYFVKGVNVGAVKG